MTILQEPRSELRHEAKPQFCPLIGISSQQKEMQRFAERASVSDLNLLLLGEMGSGKDHFAEYIHHLGKRGPFVFFDCSNQSDTLFETELFGHVAGAFTDGKHDKPGLVDVACEGTLYINEIANLPLSLQAKMLRLLEKKSYRKVGGIKELEVSTRIIAATNVDLETEVRRGRFREDLYYRLHILYFPVPPLRERKDDIVPLAKHFLSKQKEGAREYHQDTLDAMVDYSWPGNIRELQNAVIRAAHLSFDDELIRPHHVTPYLKGVKIGRDLFFSLKPNSGDSKVPTLKDYIEYIFELSQGEMTLASQISGVNRRTWYRWVQYFKLNRPKKSTDPGTS